MEDEKFAIVNDAGLTVRGIISRPKPKGRFPLVVLAGGFFDTAQSPSIKEAARLLLEEGFAVARFDFTDSFGESDGRAADMTISQRVRDLEHVMKHCKRSAYVNDAKVCVLGIGLGAMAAFVLEAFTSEAHALVLVNTPQAVDSLSWTRFEERDMSRIRLKRYFHVHLGGAPVLINYTFFEDGHKLDMSRCARNLKTPVLFLASEDSEIVPKEQSAWLYERTSSQKKELATLPGLGAVEGKRGMKTIVEQAVAFLKRNKIF